MDDKNKNFTLLVLGMMAFLANGDNYAAASLISNISKDLGLSVSTAAISVTAYMMAFGIFTLLFGPLSDRFGKVKVINTAAIGTAVFSMLGATAFNLQSLVFFRAMNGLFGAGIFPVTMALIGEMFDEKNRQSALGKVMGLAFLGGATATAIGGAIAYFGSWRMVYLIYGIGELALAIAMLRLLKRDQPVVKELKLFASYKQALTNFRFTRVVVMMFFVGFTVLGTFTYTGIFIIERTGLNVLVVGLILSMYGIGTVYGGRIAAEMRARLKNGFLVTAGAIGFVSLTTIALSHQVLGFALGLFGFGIAFILLQSTLIATAQKKLPAMKGTAMSMAAFNMFLGAAVGTSVNGQLMKNTDTSTVFFIAAFVILAVGVLAAIFVSGFEMRKRLASEV